MNSIHRLYAPRSSSGGYVHQQLVVLHDHFVVFRQCRHRGARHHVHDLVASDLELAPQVRQRLGGGVLEVVHQDAALALLLQLVNHRLDHLWRLAHLEVEGLDVGREGRDVGLGEVAQQFGRVLQGRESEERRDWPGDRVHGGRVLRPGTVVEGQHDLVEAQEAVLLEMLEAEARPAGSVDLDDAREAYAARLVACSDIVGGTGAAAASVAVVAASVGPAVF